MATKELSPVIIKMNWEDLLGQKREDMSDDIRRERWNEWKRLANEDGYSETVSWWTSPDETCHTCKHLDDDWCNQNALPCNFNPILKGLGLACMGVGHEKKQSKI